MPTYINSGTKVKAVDNHMINPGDSISLQRYINIPNMTLTSHEPYVQPNILLSEDHVLTAGEELVIAIPHPGESCKYALDIFFIDLPVHLYIDMAPTAKAITVDESTDYSEILRWDFCAYIKLVNPSATDPATVRVMVSRY